MMRVRPWIFLGFLCFNVSTRPAWLTVESAYNMNKLNTAHSGYVETTTSVRNLPTPTFEPPIQQQHPEEAPEPDITDYLRKLFSKPVPVIILVIITVLVLLILSFSSGVVHVVLQKFHTRPSVPSPTPNLTSVVTSNANKARPKTQAPSKFRFAKKAIPQKTRKHSRLYTSNKNLDEIDIDEGQTPGSVQTKSPLEQERVNLLAPDFIPPERFKHEGPLIIPKKQRFVMKHELNDSESQKKLRPDEHFEFSDRLNQVFDIGSEVEIVKSSSRRPLRPRTTIFRSENDKFRSKNEGQKSSRRTPNERRTATKMPRTKTKQTSEDDQSTAST